VPDLKYALSKRLGDALVVKQRKIVTAESCTGGGFAYELTSVVGSSAWFERGFVTYSNEAKQELLGVSEATLQKYGAVSAETAVEMAVGALRQSRADIAISVTGIAGPNGGTEDKPVGTVWFGVADKDGFQEARLGQFTSGRHYVRRKAIEFGLQWLLSRYA